MISMKIARLAVAGQDDSKLQSHLRRDLTIKANWKDESSKGAFATFLPPETGLCLCGAKIAAKKKSPTSPLGQMLEQAEGQVGR